MGIPLDDALFNVRDIPVYERDDVYRFCQQVIYTIDNLTTKTNNDFNDVYGKIAELEDEIAQSGIIGVNMNGTNVPIVNDVAQLGTVITDVSNKQDTLVSGTNIKTINNNSLLGSGNINISGGGGSIDNIKMNGSLVTVDSGTADLGTVITDISGKQDTLVSGTNIKTINSNDLLGSGNIAINSGNVRIFHGVSTTTGSTQIKVVTCPEFTNSDLVEGTLLFVYFSNGASYNGASKLNVNSTGAIDVYKYGTTLSNRYVWYAGEVVPFMYYDGAWMMVDAGIATTSYYGVTKLNTSTSSTATDMAATPSAVKSAYDLANGKQDALVSGTNIKTINSQSILGSGDLNLGTADDYIVETGISNGWTYILYNSNYIHAWYRLEYYPTTAGLVSIPDFATPFTMANNEYVASVGNGSWRIDKAFQNTNNCTATRIHISAYVGSAANEKVILPVILDGYIA